SPYETTNTWSFGTSSMQILTDLALYGDYFAPWINNSGLLKMIRSFDPAQSVPAFDWDTYAHVYADTVTYQDDLLTAPNRFVVVSNSASGSSSSIPPGSTVVSQQVSVVGTYDVPASAPHSIQNRGFVVPQIAQVQLDNPNQIQAIARSIGLSSTIYQRATV